MTEDEFSRDSGSAQAATDVGRRPRPGIARQVLAFALETALLFAVAYGAIAVFPGYEALAAAGALTVAVLFWGLLMAPRAKHRLPWPALPLVAAGVFLAGAGALMLSGLALAGLLLAAGAVVNLVWDLVSGYPAVAAPARPAGRRSARR